MRNSSGKHGNKDCYESRKCYHSNMIESESTEITLEQVERDRGKEVRAQCEEELKCQKKFILTTETVQRAIRKVWNAHQDEIGTQDDVPFSSE